MRNEPTIRYFVLALMCGVRIMAQMPSDNAGEIIPAELAVPVQQDDRMLGILPTYLVVQDSSGNIQALTKKQKFGLFLRETTDPSTFAAAGVAAALSQSGNNTPKYGVGAGPMGQRLGAAYTEIAVGNFLSDAVFASAFHQDPRYFRMGPSHSVLRRAVYSLSRIVITRTDSGHPTFNTSGLLGTAFAIGLSNAYYPSVNVNAPTVGSHFASNALGASFGNLIPEFWPDLKQKFARHGYARTN